MTTVPKPLKDRLAHTIKQAVNTVAVHAQQIVNLQSSVATLDCRLTICWAWTATSLTAFLMVCARRSLSGFGTVVTPAPYVTGMYNCSQVTSAWLSVGGYKVNPVTRPCP